MIGLERSNIISSLRYPQPALCKTRFLVCATRCSCCSDGKEGANPQAGCASHLRERIDRYSLPDTMTSGIDRVLEFLSQQPLPTLVKSSRPNRISSCSIRLIEFRLRSKMVQHSDKISEQSLEKQRSVMAVSRSDGHIPKLL
jgi:hypothetical protein